MAWEDGWLIPPGAAGVTAAVRLAPVVADSSEAAVVVGLGPAREEVRLIPSVAVASPPLAAGAVTGDW